MFYIRTEKNNYDLDVVIDVSDNKDFVDTSGLSWIQIDQSEKPLVGSYYYEGKFISIDSEEYPIIENIIFEVEEPKRIEKEEYEQKMLEEYQQRLEEELNELPPPPDPIEVDPNEVENILMEIPKPIAKPIEDVESTQENYDYWRQVLNNIEITVKAYDSNQYNVDENVITFDPPIEFSDGTIQEKVILPYSMTIEDQIEHVKANLKYTKELVDRIKGDLKITD